MKTLAYLDCPTGIAGDMCLGALVHSGVPLAYLAAQLGRLGIQSEFQLRAQTVARSQQIATQVSVDLLSQYDYHDHNHDGHDHNHHSHDHGRRRLPEIEALIRQAALPERVVAWSLAIFRRLAKAEAMVHGMPLEQVHFHEVGATDAIVDIVGTCLGFDWLKVDEVVCSPLPTGSGTVWCEHGQLPVPAPAVLMMMADAQMQVYDNGVAKELVTPTGCAIAATLAQSFGPPPRFTLQKVGLGAGGRELALPNILRLWIGVVDEPSHREQTALETVAGQSVDEQLAPEIPASEQPQMETVIELQTQVDDSSPQAIGYVFEQLVAAGAVDVFTQAVAMKKNRLGTLVTVICPESAAPACESVLFAETTTLGIRRTQQHRAVLAREMVTVTTAYGDIPIKVARARAGSTVLNLQPEYEDCARIARSYKVPWQQVHQSAIAAAMERIDDER